MSRYVVEGGIPLRGVVDAAANKNAVLPIMAATLLTDDECVLTNVPRIRDVTVMGNLLQRLGARVEGLGTNTLHICCAGVQETTLQSDLVGRLRASVVLLAPVLARCGHVRTLEPGGCSIGRRDVSTHLEALTALGATVDYLREGYEIKAKRLIGTTIFLDEASVTATENTVMGACLAQGTTVVKHAACEPHVEDFCHFLIKMGANIKGVGSNILIIQGVESLHGAQHEIISDHLDVGTFAVAAAITGGEVTIRRAVPEHLEMIALCLRRMGVELEIGDSSVTVHASQLRAVRKIATDPWPGFPTDLASIFIVLATQARGTTLIHDWMYEGRMFFIDKLVSMGANIILCDPHRCVVTGPSHLMGRVAHSPDLRAGAALVLAALAADGSSEIHDIEWVERGYENFVDRLSSLGANIQKAD